MSNWTKLFVVAAITNTEDYSEEAWRQMLAEGFSDFTDRLESMPIQKAELFDIGERVGRVQFRVQVKRDGKWKTVPRRDLTNDDFQSGLEQMNGSVKGKRKILL